MEGPDELGASLAEIGITSACNSADSVSWSFAIGNVSMAHLTADLTAEGAKTRVKLNFEINDTALGEATSQTPHTVGLFKALGEIAMYEQVDATLEKRPFDRQKIGNAFIGYAMTHPQEMAAFQKEMESYQSTVNPEQWAGMQEALSDAQIGDEFADHSDAETTADAAAMAAEAAAASAGSDE